MRYSNYMFSKGSIVFARFSANSTEYYLNGRPLIVISNPTHIMNTLICCTTGTRNKPGINISLYNPATDNYCGGIEVSRIYPYTIVTITTDQIVSSIGHLDPYIMKAVDDAVDFHLGKTDKVPGYLENVEEVICGVEYNNIRENLVSHEVINDRYYPSIPKKTQQEKSIDSEISIKHKNHENTISKKYTNQDILQWSARVDSQTADLVYKHCRDRAALPSLLDEESVALITSRIVPVSLIAQKYNINKKNASDLRITLTNIAISSAIVTLNSNKISEPLPDYIIIGMIIMKEFFPEKVKEAKIYPLYDHLEMVKEKYSIDPSNGRTWKSIETIREK